MDKERDIPEKKKTIREFVCYGLAGVTTTLINIIVYHGFLAFGLDYKWSNLIAIVFSKMYGYCVNKHFVFHSKCNSKGELLTEVVKFVFARGITGFIDYFGVIILVELCQADKVIVKYMLQVIVVILNYIMSKFVIFTSEDSGGADRYFKN